MEGSFSNGDLQIFPAVEMIPWSLWSQVGAEVVPVGKEETALSLRRLACGSLHPSHGSYTGYISFVGWIEEWGTHWFEEKTSKQTHAFL